MGSLLDELGLSEDETAGERLSRELTQADIDLIAALRRVRESLNLSQTELGARMGISQATVSSFESGEADAKLDTVRRYAHALGAQVRHSVVCDGVEFTRLGFRAAQWTGRASGGSQVSTAPRPFELGAAEAKRNDFAVAA